MADNNFRSSRGRDSLARGSADAPARGPLDDPLAELARLIGQSDPMNDDRHGSAPAPDYAAPAGGPDWAADDRRAGPGEFAEEGYAQPHDERYDDRYEERPAARYEPPRLPDPYPPPRAALALQDSDYEPPVAARFRAPAPRLPRARDTLAEQPGYRDEQEPPHGRQLPALLPRSRDNRYDYAEQDGADDHYALEDYEEDEAQPGRRRGGLVVVAAVLGLAVLGTAGAFAYRAMFGGSMLPSLPPIIKADDGPNKIMPSAANSDGGTSGQANANASGSGEKLVPRQETPINVPQPANAAPRVIATIPIFPDQTPGPPSGLPSAATSPPVAPVPLAPPASVPPPAALGPVAQGIPLPPPATNLGNGMTAAPAPSTVSGTKKIHTVAIRPDQMAGTDASAAPPQAPVVGQPPPAARPIAQQHAPRPAPVADANAPLSIVPGHANGPAPVPVRVRSTPVAATTVAPNATEPAPAASAAGGGYAVQVSSQRSEAEAQASFRELQAKFPDQLGGRHPVVRRADLGDKGIYYRALVGPFASMQQAAEMCSSLKSAGGNCIVQKD
jgi:SPOR domain